MADEQAVYETIAEVMRAYGYRDVTAAVVREIDEAPSTDERQNVVSTFAARQLQQAREAGQLPPAAERPERSLDEE